MYRTTDKENPSHKIGNIAIKGFPAQKEKTISKKMALQWWLKSGSRPFYADVILSELTITKFKIHLIIGNLWQSVYYIYVMWTDILAQPIVEM